MPVAICVTLFAVLAAIETFQVDAIYRWGLEIAIFAFVGIIYFSARSKEKQMQSDSQHLEEEAADLAKFLDLKLENL